MTFQTTTLEGEAERCLTRWLEKTGCDEKEIQDEIDRHKADRTHEWVSAEVIAANNF